MLELSNINNFFRILVVLNDIVLVWVLVIYIYKNLSMFKKSRFCFDRCFLVKGFMVFINKKDLLRLREG